MSKYVDASKVKDVIITTLEHRGDVPNNIINELLNDINAIPEALPQVIDIRFDSMGFVVAFDNGWKTRYTIGRLEEE